MRVSLILMMGLILSCGNEPGEISSLRDPSVEPSSSPVDDDGVFESSDQVAQKGEGAPATDEQNPLYLELESALEKLAFLVQSLRGISF